MFATGVGLVIKGFEYQEKQMMRIGVVKNHSKKMKGGFFDKIMNTTREWFEEDAEHDN